MSNELSETYTDADSEYISSLSAEYLLDMSTLEFIMDKDTPFERQLYEAKCLAQAKKLKVMPEFKNLLKAYKMHRAAKEAHSSGGNTTEAFPDAPIILCCGEYICSADGVRLNQAVKTSGGYEVKTVSGSPVLITEILENIENDTEKMRIAFYKNGRWKSILCSPSAIANTNKIIELADYGLEVNSDSAKLLVRYFSDLIVRNRDTIPRYKAVSHLGWRSSEFVPYSAEYKFDGEQDYKDVFESVKINGDSGKWLEVTKELRKNIIVRLVMDASLASIIIEKVHALPFIVHLWGGSGNGKTVALMVAASIWGNPKKGKMWRSINNTSNFCSQISVFFKNMPVILDELQIIKAAGENYDKLIMTLTEGMNRGRMFYNKMEKTETWDCAYIFSGEESITRENSGGGAKNRVIEIECREKIIADGQKTAEFLCEHYGWLGTAFTLYIKNCSDLSERYSRNFNSITAECDTTEKQAMAMAAIMTADEIVSSDDLFYKDEKPLEISDIKPFLMTSGEVDITRRAWEYTVNMIAANSARFSEDCHSELWGRIDNDEFVFINKTILTRELFNAGFEFDAVKRKWTEHGWLIRNSAGKMYHQTKCNGVKASYIKLNLSENESSDSKKPPF